MPTFIGIFSVEAPNPIVAKRLIERIQKVVDEGLDEGETVDFVAEFTQIEKFNLVSVAAAKVA